MIKIRGLVKNFETARALDRISLDIQDGGMFGLLGTNGAGKSTLLRILAGILEPDEGEIFIDGDGNPADPSCKENIFYLPDDPYYFPNASMGDMVRFYSRLYPGMDGEGAAAMAESLHLDMNIPLRTFSKGMKRQAFLILALCSGTKYLLCDEVFDGLDPVVTEVMKNLFRQEMKERALTVVVASHKLNDLEDLCGNIVILHRGGVVTTGDLKTRGENIRKFQFVIPVGRDLDGLDSHPSLIRWRREGNFVSLTARGSEKEIRALLERYEPEFLEEVPLSLEEMFIEEMEEEGYDIRKVLS